MPSLLTITEIAQNKIYDFIQAKDKKPLGLRISLKTKGCSGLSWNLDLIDEQNKFDEVVDVGKFKVFIDPKAVLYILGSTIDYKTSELEEGFEFSNPNEKSRCGCGESFKV